MKIKAYLDGAYTTKTEIGSIDVSSSSASEGETVVITPYPNYGFLLSNVTVKTTSGVVVSVTKKSNGTYIFTQPDEAVVVSVYFNTAIIVPDSDSNNNQADFSYFNDVKVTDTFCAAVNNVVSQGLMSGTGDGYFGPHDSITRGMIVTILYLMSGETAQQNSDFVDVNSSDYFSKAVAWASSVNIVSGYDDGTFRPYQAITREELAVILHSYCKNTGAGELLWHFPLTYTDVNSVSSWATTAVSWLVNKNIMEERYDNFFLPQATSTRAEVAVVISLLMK